MAEVHAAERLELEAIARRFEGSLGIYAMRLDDPSNAVDVAPDEVFPAASLITVPIALEVLCQIDEGYLAAGERIALRREDKVVGPGVLGELADGLTPTVSDLLYLALSVSDYTAANMLIERVGLFSINKRLDKLGLEKTRLAGKLFIQETKNGPLDPEDFGISLATPKDDRDDGRGERSPTTARELVKLFNAIHKKDDLPVGACDDLLDLLQKGQTASAIRRGLPEARFRDRTPAKLANKTGSIRGVVNDAGIVATDRGAYAVALLTKGSKDLRPTQDNVARIALAEASRVIYKAMRGE